MYNFPFFIKENLHFAKFYRYFEFYSRNGLTEEVRKCSRSIGLQVLFNPCEKFWIIQTFDKTNNAIIQTVEVM